MVTSNLGDEREAVVVLEYVEQSAVEHRVELFIEGGQLEGIPNQEAGAEAPVPGLALGGLDGGRRHIDAGGVKPELGRQERVLSGTATNIEEIRPRMAPACASVTNAGWGRPMSHGGVTP